MNAIELIHQFLSDRLGVDTQQVTNSTVLTDIGVDSLLLAELVFAAEDRLKIVVNFDVTPPVTVGDLIVLIESLQSKKSA